MAGSCLRRAGTSHLKDSNVEDIDKTGGLNISQKNSADESVYSDSSSYGES